jgi:hypothetical protein
VACRARLIVVTFWKGDTNYWPSGLTSDDEGDSLKGIDFSTAGWVEPGDTIERLIIQWTLTTDLHLNSDVLGQAPVPWVFGVWFRPNPDQFFEGDTVNAWQTLENDSLYTEITEWKPYHWTDGTLHSTQWYASSGGWKDVKGGRTIHDPSESALLVQVLGLDAIGLASPGSNVTVTVGGHYNVKMLIKR